MVPDASPLAREDGKTGLEAAPGPLARATLLLGLYSHLVLLRFSLGSQHIVTGLRCGSSQGPALTPLASNAHTSDHPPMPLPLRPAPLPPHGGLHLGETPE